MASLTRHHRRAVALLISLGVLFVLSVLAVSFVRMQQLERRAGKSYAHLTRAKLAAEAGVRRALAGINEYVSSGTINMATADWRYHGEDANKNGIADAGEDTNGNGLVEFEECPIEHATAPSFQMLGKTYSGEIRNKSVASGVVSNIPYREPGIKLITYTLKVIDTSSQLDLNWGTREVLGKILDNLGRAIDPVSPPIKPGEGAKIVDYRMTLAKRSFFSKEDLLSLSFISQDDFDRFEKFITVFGWRDPNVLNPIKFDNTRNDPDSLKDDIKSAEIVERAPVNINGAPREVLIAILSGITASYVEDIDQVIYPNIPSAPNTNGSSGKSVVITPADADKLAAEIVAYRIATGPFRTWNVFFTWLSANSGTIFSGSTTAHKLLKADVVFANLNPNTDSQKFNPNFSWASLNRRSGGEPAFRGCDKWDLLTTAGTPGYTTEGTLTPTGTYIISSLGKVIDKFDKVIAEFKIRATVRAYEQFRLSSQYDFEGASGTAGHRKDLLISGLSTKSGVDTYPEYDPRSWSISGVPQKVISASSGSSTSLTSAPAIYDGQLMLSTRAVGSAGTLLYSSFRPDGDGRTDDLRADLGSNSAAFAGHILRQRSVIAPETSSLEPVERESGSRVTAPRFEWNSNLLPDGVLFASRRQLAYGGGTIPSALTVEMWVKMLFNTKNDRTDDLVLRDKRSSDILYGSGYSTNGFASKEPTLFLDMTIPSRYIPSPGLWESILSFWANHDTTNTLQVILQDDATNEWHSAWHSGDLERGEWHHIGLVIDSIRNKLIVNGRENIGPDGANQTTVYIYNSNWGIFNTRMKPAMAHCTMDEIRVYPGARDTFSVIGNYLAGRYRTSGFWRSPWLTIPGGSSVTFLSATWTEHIPDNLTGNIKLGFSSYKGKTLTGAKVFSDPALANKLMLSGDRMRIRAEFSASSKSGALIDTPVLDSITVAYQRGGAQILKWETFFKR